jgi:RimJ/RimL family protein N-acetyltransferase
MEIALRDVIDSDLQIFFKHQREPEANQMAAFPSRNRETFMAHWSKIRKDKSNLMKTILYHGQVAGNVVSFIMDGQREVGYWVGRDFWGRGLATKALKIFLEIEEKRPLYGVVAVHNIASQRVLEKCGFEIHHRSENEIILVLR